MSSLGRLHFCGYMRGSSQLSSGCSQLSSSQLSSAHALQCTVCPPLIALSTAVTHCDSLIKLKVFNYAAAVE